MSFSAALVLATLLVPAPTSAAAGAQLDTPPAADLLATGQTTPYVGNDGEVATGNRDDGDLIAGRAQRYTEQGTNLVVDDNTGLMWIGNPSLAELGAYAWSDAIAVANELDYGGFTDWRMPNLKELQTLIDYSRTAPVLNQTAFPRPYAEYPSDYAWSSTTSPGNPADAWYVNLLNGHTYGFTKTAQLGLLPVRDAGGAINPVAVMRTGQTELRVAGDDGDLQHGIARSYTIVGTPDDAITTQGRNLVADDNTGLMWIRDPFLVTGGDPDGLAGGTDLSQATDWQAAITKANELNYGSYSDWRMPNLVELESISRPGSSNGLYDSLIFANGPVDPLNPDLHIWWSSTTSAFDRSDAEPGAQAAWYVTTALGATNFKAENVAPAKARLGFMRPVRSTTASPSTNAGLAEVRSSADFEAITITSPRADVLRQGKFVVPTTAHAPNAPFVASFQNVATYPLHLEFLVNEYPAAFAGLTEDQYLGITGNRAARQYWAGGLRSFTTADGTTAYGFEIAIDQSDPSEAVTAAEVAEVHTTLSESFRRRPLVYSPTSAGAIAEAATWVNPPFEIAYPTAVADPNYEAYTTGRAYGTIRIFTLGELLEAAEAGDLSSQDIVVVDGAPSDLASVVAAIITAERQSPLAHLTIRTARRGTPNMFVNDPATALAAFDGQLARLDVTGDTYSISTGVTIEEAQAWWLSIRPDPIQPAPADDTYAQLDELSSIGAQPGAIGRIGGKAANLAALFTVLDDEYEVDGFAIAFSAYHDFINTNTLLDVRSDPPVVRTYSDYLDTLHSDAEFLSDSSVRAAVLADLIDEMRDNGIVDPTLLASVSARVDQVFGPGTKVRFRSSSNAEDALQFSGAGLYDSTSACVADANDGDTDGPSLCDPGQDKERTVERALKKVWASLWNFGAWEERNYFGMRHVDTRMGILVSTAFPNERANGVAFTGDPAGLADGYLINVQDGDTSVVFPESGVTPETNQLIVADGSVESIGRIRPSSLVPDGAVVMTDAELTELGEVMAQVNSDLPVDTGVFDRDDILLDFEFKLRRSDNQLLFKQVRPFLRPSADSNEQAEARIEAPAELDLCGSWREGLGWRDELAQQVVLTLAPGETIVDFDSPGQTTTLFDHMLFGTQAVSAVAAAPGTVTVDDAGAGAVDVTLSRSYSAGAFSIDADFTARNIATDQFSSVRLDAAALQTSTRITATITDTASNTLVGTVRLVPCVLDAFTENTFDLTLGDGTLATFVQRRERADGVSGLAALTEALVQVDGLAPIQVDAPSRLVYGADRHHWNEEFVAIFDSPLNGYAGLVFRIDSGAAGVTGYRAAWLDGQLNEVPLDVASVNDEPVGTTSTFGPELGISVSCLAGNGRVNFNIVNVNAAAASYRIEFAGLTPRARVVSAGDWWRMPITGRPDGDYPVALLRDGEIIANRTLTIACDIAEPQVDDGPVAIVNACRAGNGYLIFQFTNPSAAPMPYIIEFANVANRSTTAAAYGQAVRAVTGRPDGDWPYRIRSGGSVLTEGVVRVSCD